MNEELLRLFVEVAELGSFSAVANNHWLSQRAVAQRMRRFEQQVGVALFIRQSNKLALTPAGRHFLADAKRLLAMMDQAYESLAGFQQSSQRPFAIGYSSQYNAAVIQRALAAFKATTQLKTVKAAESELIKAVQQGELDCAVINDGLGFDMDFAKLKLAALVIATDDILMKCSQKFVQADTKFFPEKLFKILPLVYTGANVSDYMKKALLLSLHDVKNVRLQKVDSFGQMQVMIASGQAISFCGKKLARDEAREGIAYLPLKISPQPQMRFTLIFDPANQSRDLKRLITFYQTNQGHLL